MKDNVLPRICKTCGISFFGGPRAFYCPECRQERKKEQSKRYKERNKNGSTTPLGSIIQCESCGCDIIKRSGLQRFCKKCAKKHLKIIDNKQSLVWNKNNQVKVFKTQEDIDRAKDWVKFNNANTNDYSFVLRKTQDGYRIFVAEKFNQPQTNLHFQQIPFQDIDNSIDKVLVNPC